MIGLGVVPAPVSAVAGAGSFVLDESTQLRADQAAITVAENLADAVRPLTGVALTVSSEPSASCDIALLLDGADRL